MKKVRAILSMAAIAFATMALIQSCAKPCKDEPCGANGTCVEDGKDYTCNCNAGYEGTNCETEMRTKFGGTYSLNDACDANTYNSTISNSSSDVEKVLISNFANVFINSVTAKITNSTDITIDSQEPDNDDWLVQGSGSINTAGTTITLSYTVTDPSNVQTTCSTTWTKQ